MDEHWKERKPEETIQIIKDFFNTCGYHIKLYGNEKTEAGTWHCSVFLYKNKQFIMQTNGKGMTEAYSQASAYAELYERFCNKTNFIRIPAFVKAFTTLQEKFNGYKFYPGEKKLTYEDICAVPNMNQQLQLLLHNKENINRYLNILTDKDPIGEPYTNLATGELAYYDPRLIHFMCASNGQAAGNTVEEALNQGLSELTERMAERLFLEKPQDIYYRINLNKIINSALQEKIQKIEEAGNKLYVYDLSYNFGYPTIMSVVINDEINITNVNFGSFPIFDIAFERTLTEVYQAQTSMKNYTGLQEPFKNNKSFNEFKNSLGGCACIPEDCFLCYEVIDKPSNTFLTGNYSNKELNKYFIDLFSSFGMSIYYIDHSLINDLSAVQIFIPEYNYIDNDQLKYKYISNIVVDNSLTYIETIDGITNDIIHQKFTNIVQDIQNAAKITQNFNWEGNYAGKLQFNDGLNILPVTLNNIFLIFKVIGQHMDDFQSLYSKVLQKIYTIRNYINAGYTNDEIINIFDNLFNIKITDYDINNCDNWDYVIDATVVKPILEYYYSQDYREILVSFLYKDKML